MKGQYRRFFAILKAANQAGLTLTKEEAVGMYTRGRTESLSSLEPAELEGLEGYLSSMTAQQRLGVPSAPPGGSTCDKMRKGIIAVFKSIGKDVGDAKRWAEKYGVFGRKKAFNDYTEQELWQLLRNAEQMKRDHIKAVNRAL
jgi:hypothetical protein